MNNMFVKTTSATIAALLLSFSASYAQSVSSGQVLNALKPKHSNNNVSATRSFGVQKKKDSVSSSERSFIRSINTTRAIKVEQREKLIAIVEKKELPSINIRILFDYDSDRIKESSYPNLDEISTALSNKALAEAKIMLNGHTDAVGSREYNQDLSERRALSVKRYLTQFGKISEHRLVVAGFGEDRLRDSDDPANSINRRVEIVNLGE
jgi:outer membrane protein OmpA-like peptidoglycan-associated protein